MLGNFIHSLLDIVYPKACILCKTNLKNRTSIDNLICMPCWLSIKKNLPPFCKSCGRNLDKKNLNKNICHACIKKQLHFDRAFSPCLYEGTMKNLIHAFKYQGKDYLGASLSRLMIEFIIEYNLPLELVDFIIPLPLHNTKLREREFNQAQILSNHLAGYFHKDLLNNCLGRLRLTPTQTELKDTQRFLNVKGSFCIRQREKLSGKNILLVDDVLTTGATSSEAAYALKDAGANTVFVLTVAN